MEGNRVCEGDQERDETKQGSERDKAGNRHSGGTEAEGWRERAFGELRPRSWSARGRKDCGGAAQARQPRGRATGAGADVPCSDLS